MGKSDLIEKINARVKSQMSSLTARTAAKTKADEKESGGADVGEKRITSRTGTVVVRRRVPARGEAEPAPSSAAATPAADVAEAAFVEARAESSTPPDRGFRAADRGSEMAGAVAEPADLTEQAVTVEPGSESFVEPVTAPEPPGTVPTEPEAAPVMAEAAASPAVQVVVEAPAPVAEAAGTVEEASGPETSAAPESEVGASAPPTRTRSIEDVLAQEYGRVPVQHRAMVIGEVRHTAMPRTEVVTKGVTTERAAERQASPSAQAAAAPLSSRRAPVGHSPTAVKEIANEERKKEKAVVKSGVPGRSMVEERGAKPKKSLKKKEVLQKRDVVAPENEPHFRKHRRVAVKREKGKTKLTTPKAIKRVIRIEDAISVGELAHRMGIKAPAVIKRLIPLGVMATINQSIDHDTASLIASEFGYEVENVAFDESVLLADVADRKEDLSRRPPVVTIMGHVDHGKTTLLDAIRHTDVASKEAGGITQHIGAYTVETEGGRIVFLDTPGHEAFTAMRARGAEVTDIVVLVVAADDGVMPQTVEALNHAKAAKVPIIVAVNKIDKPGANPDRIRQKLSEYELVPEDWGGQTIYAEVSAKAKLNIKELLELILLQAEVLELEANPNRPARATVVESQLDKGRGPVATVLVNNGTLRVGDVVVVGAQYGKVRAMVDDKGKSVKEAGPSMPVEILGLSGVPEAGDTLAVVEDLDAAKAIAENRSEKARELGIVKSSKVTLEDLFSQMQRSELKELKLILKTDVQGSLEAFQKAITELSTDAVKTNILHSGVGAISEGDVMLASASKAIILGFNVRPDPKASALAELEGVQVNTYSVIYEAIDDLKLAMQGLLKPIMKEKVLGHAEVRETFSIPKIGLIAGTSVTDGKISRSAQARLLRSGKVLWEGRFASLRRFKDDVREVEKGYECGIGLESFNDVKLGDIIEAYTIEETRPSL